MPCVGTEDGRQWATVIERWFIDNMGFEQVKWISKLFIKMNDDGTIKITQAKMTDELLFDEYVDTMEDFYNKITKRLKVSKILLDKPIEFNGCRILQDDEGNIIIICTDT